MTHIRKWVSVRKETVPVHLKVLAQHSWQTEENHAKPVRVVALNGYTSWSNCTAIQFFLLVKVAERKKLNFSLQDRCTKLQITALHAPDHFLAITNFSKQFLHTKAESDAVRLQQPSESRVNSPTAVNSCSLLRTNPELQLIPRHSVLCAVGYEWAPAGYKQDKVLRVGPVPELVLSRAVSQAGQGCILSRN
jgi:hypothetical protein